MSRANLIFNAMFFSRVERFLHINNRAQHRLFGADTKYKVTSTHESPPKLYNDCLEPTLRHSHEIQGHICRIDQPKLTRACTGKLMHLSVNCQHVRITET